jgi:phosphatidylglycerol:prolipoprotein diacylglycerol transferase
MDPVIFHIFGWPVRWYGLIVMSGVMIGTFIAGGEVRRRGENDEVIWDLLFWILIPGFVGARLWFIVNSILGGNTSFIDDPITMLYIWKGGIHFFGGLLFGGIALYFFIKKKGMDIWLFLDAIAPAALIGQAIGRIANFINQELYGPPTTLPWGILVEAEHRTIPPYDNLSQFPVETTRFHPTFAYEMILNIILALLLLWISRQYRDRMKPGAIFTGWLISAGFIRTFIELFRPDQPRIGDTFVTYSMFVSFLMAVSGVIMLFVRYGKLQLAFAEGWENEYHLKPIGKKIRTRVKATTIDVSA